MTHMQSLHLSPLPYNVQYEGRRVMQTYFQEFSYKRRKNFQMLYVFLIWAWVLGYWIGFVKGNIVFLD